MVTFPRKPVSFPLGMVGITPGAKEVLEQIEVAKALMRHQKGDWGDLEECDIQANNDALVHGARLFSAYHSAKGEKFWIITEADRSSTTILLPSEY